jgi:hypothetical protein
MWFRLLRQRRPHLAQSHGLVRNDTEAGGKLSRRILWAVGALVLCVAVAALGPVLLSRSACRAATKNGTVRDFRNFSGEELERDVRGQVPLGSSRALVENFLIKQEMKFSYDSSLNATLASAPCLRGSGIVAKSLGLTFRFDHESKLVAIESRVHLMGP